LFSFCFTREASSAQDPDPFEKQDFHFYSLPAASILVLIVSLNSVLTIAFNHNREKCIKNGSKKLLFQQI